MTVLPSIFFKGILLFAICGPQIICGNGATDFPEYKFGNKRIYSTTAAGEEEELSSATHSFSSEEPEEEITTVFDFKRKPSTVKSFDDDSSSHSSTYSWTTPRPRSNKENSVKPLKDEVKDDSYFTRKITPNYNAESFPLMTSVKPSKDEDNDSVTRAVFDKNNNATFPSKDEIKDSNDDKIITRKTTLKYNEGISPSEIYSPSSPSVKKFKNFELKNQETSTADLGNVRYMSSHSSYEYSSSTVEHLDGDDEYTEEPESHSSSTKTPLDHIKNIDWKNSEFKKKNSKKESTIDNSELVDKIKTEKPVKDLNFKSDKPLTKNQETIISTIKPVNPEALDNYDSTIIISIENDKAVKNISVNNESGSNLLEPESFSNKMDKNPKSEGISDLPQSFNSVINKNSVTAENVEILNKTPTIKYSIKDPALENVNNKTSSGFYPLRNVEESTTTFTTSVKVSNYSTILNLDDSKNTIPVSQKEPPTEATFKLKQTIVPDNDILNLNVSTNDRSNDIKKKVTSFQVPSLSTSSDVIDNSKEVESKATTVASTVPRANIEFKNKLGLSSSFKSKSLSTGPSLPLDSSTTKYQVTTSLPSIINYLSTSRSISASSFQKGTTVENTPDENFTTTLATTISNDLIKPITRFTTRRRPSGLNFLSSTTPSEVSSSSEPSFATTRISFNYSTSSYRPSQTPSLIDNTVLKSSRTVNRYTTESTTKIRPIIQWSTLLQRPSTTTTTESSETTSPYTSVLTTENDMKGLMSERSTSPGSFESSTESSSTTAEELTRISTPESSFSTPSYSLSSSSSSSQANSMTASSMFDVPSVSTASSDKDTSHKSVTSYSVSMSSGSSKIPDSITTESGISYSESDVMLRSSIEDSVSTESVTLSSVSVNPEFFETSTQNSSELVEESVSPFPSSTQSYSSEISPMYSTNTSEKSFSSDVSSSSVETVSENADIASGFTSGIIHSSTPEMVSSSSSLPSSLSYSSYTPEDDEFLYTSESVSSVVLNETSSSLPEFDMSSSTESLHFSSSQQSTTPENDFPQNSSGGYSDNYSPVSKLTTESVFEVSSVSSFPDSSTLSTASYENYTSKSTENMTVNKSSTWTEQQVTTVGGTTVHEPGGDDSYDPEEEDWLMNNSSDHQFNKQSTSTTTERVISSPVNPTSFDPDFEIDEDEERSKNESYVRKETHRIRIDDKSSTSIKPSISEDTNLTVTEVNIFGNESRTNVTSQQESINNFTVVPVNKNYSIEPEIFYTTQAIETTEISIHPTTDQGTTFIQYTTFKNSRDNIPVIQNWTINNVSEYLVLRVDATVSEVCRSEDMLRKDIIRLFKNGTGRSLRGNQIAFLNLTPLQCSQLSNREPALVEMTFVNESGNSISPNLNKDFIRLYNHKGLDGELKVQAVQLMFRRQEHVPEEFNNSTAVAAITISCIAVVCLLLLGVLLVILRKRQKGFNYGQRCTPVSLDDYSLDNISVYNSVRRKNAIRASKRSYGNPAFDDPGAPSHPLNFAALANFCTNRKAIDDEYSLIPMVSPKMDELPPGAETKNRYANVIPLPETRVHLTVPEGGEPLSDYINANYVKGPKGAEKFYIACQAPLQSTVNDFWRMIWEQQSKIILMLTDLHENGVEKCYDYLPPSEVLDCHRLFGDYQVTLKKREVREKYIISLLQLKNLETNLWREVTHMWYMSWPHQGVPDEGTSIIAFLIEARSYMRSTSGPHVVHCSPGTGRTGTVLAIDLCIRDFEANRLVDIPKTVYALRRDRAGSVQTKDQYAFIYQVLNIYAAKLTGGALDSI